MAKSLPLQRHWRDRLRQVLLFEAGGLCLITPGYVLVSGQAWASSLSMLCVMALLAALWNAVFNTVFDRIEGLLSARRADRRPHHWRVLHACLFEGGLVLLTLPVVMSWTRSAWWPALQADLGLSLVYLVYAYFFGMIYDRFFPIA